MEKSYWIYRDEVNRLGRKRLLNAKEWKEEGKPRYARGLLQVHGKCPCPHPKFFWHKLWLNCSQDEGWEMLVLRHLRNGNSIVKAGAARTGRVWWSKPKCQMKNTCIHSCYLNKTIRHECRPMKIPEVATKSSEAKAVLDAGYVFWQAHSDELTPRGFYCAIWML